MRPERFELPTPWFEAKYSIQLSYGSTMGHELNCNNTEMRATSISDDAPSPETRPGTLFLDDEVVADFVGRAASGLLREVAF